ncbi:tannase/feruloyl esterase family alpha/beta hydrolase [Dactylosporangium matsuzakiense]|uniref:tannase/feruloyl esterase family alpha/beta hydrolase n=1 Tax=Dactylosporangium matsuzakiense TaxID=53360 RepID=UPI0021C479BF|nr:tannase/feruloyl esterase family alpha/beta hydrolase [Dactylosporangium matsuzakiense]UWZ41473.1 tannase/feruloyl esterase family alpha/beta hydrolase [Dactylosporangium matsuzakiense]
MRARLWGRKPGRAVGLRALPALLAVLALAGGGPAGPYTTVAAVPGAAGGSGSGPAVVLPKVDCASLAGQDLSETPGAAAVVGSATATTSPGGWAACEVKGIAAPQIQFDVLLPTRTWRQRYLQTGCGAFCGSVDFFADAADGCVPLDRGDFVVATNNEGHVGVSGFDATFGADPQLRVDFGYRADHVVAVVAKRLIALYYGQGPRYSYFDGCSQGGHQGLTEAQRYPHDFDGIVAGAPASLLTSLIVWSAGWHATANTDAQGRPILTAAKLPALHAAVLRECDARDGLADGQIDDPRACSFDPRSLRCPPGTDTATCLTDAQVDAVRKLYDGPRDERGRRMYPGGEPVGSEANWARWVTPTATGAPAVTEGNATSALKYLAYPAPRPSMTLRDLHYDSATFYEIYQRAGIYDASDPDLSAFRAAGGKLLLWHGWADQAISPYGTIAYYHALTERMGGVNATQRFARLFMLPGVAHCGDGQGPDAFDAITPTLAWVEQGVAPDRLVATKRQDDAVVRTRPVYPYPIVARYDGSGSSDDAANFTPAPPPVRYEDDIAWLGSFRSGYEQVCGWQDGRWTCTPAPPPS